MQKKKLLLIIGIVVAVALAAALIVFWVQSQPKPQPPASTDPTEAPGVAFTVVVVHGDGSEKTFQYRSEEEYLGAALLKEGLIAGENGAYGLYIKTVDGEKAVYEEDNAYWGFFIGEEYAMTGVDMTPIEEGKVYKLVYTKA